MFDLLVLLPPAIIISISAFLIYLFGKVTTDHAPFADDRKWKREVSGVLFVLSYIVTPVAGVFFAVKLIMSLISLNLFQFCWDLFLQSVLSVVVIIIVLSFKFIEKRLMILFIKTKQSQTINVIFNKRVFFLFSQHL